MPHKRLVNIGNIHVLLNTCSTHVNQRYSFIVQLGTTIFTLLLLSSKTLKWVEVSIQSYMGIAVAN